MTQPLRTLTLFTALAAMLLPPPTLLAQPPAPHAAPRAVLVELFTSEGCSSCPPADALLRRINRSHTAAGQLIVGISEHVTYWNSLGWTDPFSQPAFTERQGAYARSLNLDSVYTPQMVVNGRTQFVGSDPAALQKAIEAAQQQPLPIDLRLLTVSLQGNTLVLTFSATNTTAGSADIFVVIADDLDQSSVQRGENSGRTLAHAAVARSMQRIAALQPTAGQTVRLLLPPSFQPAAAHHIILFAQQAHTGRVLGIDTQPI